ncbi:hypothetical protein COT50_04160 [candidate division WWE3 bacterium CG08_land_8_20_14_0_20_41_10]|uniref:TVP38/TMEM64 family membrane protein n=1 Tax=candidate division WWE3 bacterium CG08_land_8_20_14_0_20_41_10 TaxID=1975085 RepID=A0A2H0XAR0_UNCKA|nr:MAG: hypothetical protein COT50_04160 [candidate division WWE3 bacterium CG08_land_8_20_14_0_20_41_10]
MKEKTLKSITSVIGLVLSLAVLYLIAKNIHDAQIIILKAGIAGPAVAIFLYALFAPTPISTDPLTLICGAMYGPFYGSAIAWMGNNVAALVEYFLGTRISKNTEFEKEKKKLPFGLSRLPINSIPVLTLGRMIPFYGSKVISIMAGMYGVPVKRYVWTSALINLTGAIMLSYGGFRALDYLKSLF